MHHSEVDSESLTCVRNGGKNFRFLFFVVPAAFLILIYSCYKDSEVSRSSRFALRSFNRSLEVSLSSATKASPVILLWTSCYSITGNWLPQPSSLGCPVSDCIITTDKKIFNVSDAVVFHLRSVNVSDLPTRRDPNQKWVLFNGEAPTHTPSNILEELTGSINWTATYRMDSDIYAPYGWITRRRDSVSTAVKPLAGRKLVCWLVSNCKTPSRRERFVDIMKKYIPIDIYGKCGNLRCPVDDRFGCYKALSKKYKFYLSFENSICQDYITEKLFNALRTDMVPVVMGGADYSSILPPNSYIDALSFPSPRHLAEYLQELDRNDDKYLSYLAWKKDYDVLDGMFLWSCELCRKLHLKTTKTHYDLTRWWFQHSDCSSWFKRIKNPSNRIIE